MAGWIHRSLVGFDQFLNVLTGGLPDETISSRSQRAADRGNWAGIAMTKFLHLFQKDHGHLAEQGDLDRAEAVEQAEEKALKEK
jgi:hypothetical protein